MPAKKALDRAKIHLLKRPNTVFYTTILFSLKQEFTEQIETAATDGRSLFVNPVFFVGLPDAQRMGVLVHEIMHPILGHITKCGKRDHNTWNKAGDHVINLCLLAAGYELPEWVLKDTRFLDMSTEQVYDILIAEHKKMVGDGCAGTIGIPVPGGSDIQQPTDPVKHDAIEAEIASMVIRAVTQAKLSEGIPGEMPGEMQVHLQNVLNPKLPWSTIYQNYMSEYAKADYTWSRPNRRYMPDYYLPTAFSEAVCNLVNAVDSSGSVLDEEFGFFIAEIAMQKELLKPELIQVIDFDTKINCIHNITEDVDPLKDLTFTGRGGTDVKEVLRWAQVNEPTVLTIFTDGEFYWPNKRHFPTCPVIWIIHDNPKFTAPFGEVIHYDMDTL